MRSAVLHWLIALIEVAATLLALTCVVACAGAVIEMTFAGANAELVLVALSSGILSVLGPLTCWFLRGLVFSRLQLQRRGFPVLPPR